MLRIVAFDPGLSNFGYAAATLGGPDTGGLVLTGLGVLVTKKSDAKHKVLQADDSTRRLREIATFVLTTYSGNTHLVCAESMSFPRNSSAAAKMAMTWGVMVSLAVRNNASLLQASPQQVKLKLCGRGDASKEDVEAAVLSKYPQAAKFLADMPRGVHNHAYDALAVLITCLDSDQVRLLRAVAATAGS